jgi:hypothetical protein
VGPVARTGTSQSARAKSPVPDGFIEVESKRTKKVKKKQSKQKAATHGPTGEGEAAHAGKSGESPTKRDPAPSASHGDAEREDPDMQQYSQEVREMLRQSRQLAAKAMAQAQLESMEKILPTKRADGDDDKGKEGGKAQPSLEERIRRKGKFIESLGLRLDKSDARKVKWEEQLKEAQAAIAKEQEYSPQHLKKVRSSDSNAKFL